VTSLLKPAFEDNDRLKVKKPLQGPEAGELAVSPSDVMERLAFELDVRIGAVS